MEFACGHSGDIPADMGRGESRKRRLATYFARRCPVCAEEHLRNHAAQLTLVDGTLYTPEQQSQFVAKRLARLLSTY
jgi:hypothetical protein